MRNPVRLVLVGVIFFSILFGWALVGSIAFGLLIGLSIESANTKEDMTFENCIFWLTEKAPETLQVWITCFVFFCIAMTISFLIKIWFFTPMFYYYY